MSIVQDPGKTSVSNWELARSFVEDAVSGAEVASCLLALSVACLPLAGDGLVHCRLALLWYSLSPLFCELAGSALS